MTQFLTLKDVDVFQKTVLVRADLNVPMHNGVITDTTRIDRLLPTLKSLIQNQAKIILISHFGRPKGRYNEEDSLKKIIPVLSQIVNQPILFAQDCIGEIARQLTQKLQPSQILLLENLRFHEEEENNDENFAKALASLADVYVNDAFSCSHRAHASVVAITQFLPAIAGKGMENELKALSAALETPKRPLMSLVGGSKISTKLALLENLIQKVDRLVVGGGMANTFLKALGYPIGTSLYEAEMLRTAEIILEKAKKLKCEIILPQDVAVTPEIKDHMPRHIVSREAVGEQDKIVDIGPLTIAHIHDRLKECGTVVWNGPIGIFEIPPFDVGTTEVAKLISHLTTQGTLISIAGGGDTLAALSHAGVEDTFSYTSTAGGAFLEWLEGKELPGVKALMKAKKP